MFFLDPDSENQIQEAVGGRVQSSIMDVYDTQRRADILGGQSWSEMSAMEDKIAEQVDRIRELTGEELDANTIGLNSYLNGNLRTIEDGEGPAYGRGAAQHRTRLSQKQRLDTLNATFTRLKEQYPNEKFKTFDDMRDDVAEEARKAWEVAQETASRATTTGQLTGQAMAGTVQAFNEPATVAGVLVTAPLAFEALAGGLLLKIGQLALIEGGVGAGTEAFTQDKLRDYYLRQGFTEQEADKRINEAVIGAGVGAAVLAPVGVGLGKVLSKGGTALVERLRSSDPKLMREALDELDSVRDELDADTRADLDNAREALDLQDSMPDASTPDILRETAAAVDGLINDFENGTPTVAPRPKAQEIDADEVQLHQWEEAQAKEYLDTLDNDEFVPDDIKKQLRLETDEAEADELAIQEIIACMGR